jgi:ankyrin repeat protein
MRTTRMLGHGTNPFLRGAMDPDRGGRYGIHYQALEGRTEELAASLAAGVDPSIADRGGWTPLHFAAQSLDPEAVQLLVSAGADLEARNSFGATPLMIAFTNARNDDRGVIAILLEAGADLDAENNSGISPRKAAEIVANFDLKRYIPPGA